MPYNYQEFRTTGGIGSRVKEFLTFYTDKLRLPSNAGFEIGNGSLINQTSCIIGNERVLKRSGKKGGFRVYPEGLAENDDVMLYVYPAANGELVLNVEGGAVEVKPLVKEDFDSLKPGRSTAESKEEAKRSGRYMVDKDIGSISVPSEVPISVTWKSGNKHAGFHMITGYNKKLQPSLKINYAIA